MFDLLFPILLGLAFGCLVNYLADVLPATRSFSRPVCPHCSHVYTLKDYLLGRSCRQCGHGHGIRFWLVLLFMAAANLYIWLRPPSRIGFELGSIVLAYFGVVFVIDLEHRLILHPTSVVGGLLGLGVGWLSNGILPTILGGIGGFAIMLVLYYLGVLFSRLRARRLRSAGQVPEDEEALGAGDVILAGVLGLILGWPLIWFGLLMGILLAGVFGILLIASLLISRRYRTQALMVFMPYGPFLILSAIMILFLPTWLVAVVPM
jgi:leader peptidase (prepilin peptidase)/N-methyltransferase